MDSLKVACSNTRGYLSSIPYLKELLIDVDVLAISEHWLHSNKLNILNGISDTHHVFGRSSKLSSAEHYGSGRGQGGVAIFWRKSIAGFSKVTNIIHDRACMIRYQSQNGVVLFFISLYLPSQGSQDDLRTALDEISEIVDSRENGSHVILLGDFNVDIGTHGGLRGSRHATQRGMYVMDFLNRHSMVAMNMQPVAKGPVDTFVSHNGKSTIDYIAVPSYLSGGIKACHVKGWHPLNTSDHRVIHMTLPVNGLTAMPNETQGLGRVKWEKSGVRNKYSNVIRRPLEELHDRITDSDLDPGLIDGFFAALTSSIHNATTGYGDVG